MRWKEKGMVFSWEKAAKHRFCLHPSIPIFIIIAWPIAFITSFWILARKKYVWFAWYLPFCRLSCDSITTLARHGEVEFEKCTAMHASLYLAPVDIFCSLLNEYSAFSGFILSFVFGCLFRSFFTNLMMISLFGSLHFRLGVSSSKSMHIKLSCSLSQLA